MTEELLIQLMNQINDEHIVHGSCEVKFSFHDGRIEFYELTSPEPDNHLFDSHKAYHAKDKSDKNVIWSWCGTDISFDKGELKYYEETFGAQFEQTNQNYIKSRHKERVVTMDEWRKKAMHAPEEQILQIGRMEQYPEVEVFLSYFEEYLTWLNK